jgi:ubiquinone biosynthesis UbiH/UbiF/VisC/COQ6 family hydroxylase
MAFMNNLPFLPAAPAPLTDTDVCIVGNGAIAKTAALGFSQAGHSVTLLIPPAALAATPVSAPAPMGWDARVYALNHTAQGLLSSLKVWGALDAARVASVEAMAVKGDGAVNSAGSLAFDAFGAHTGALAWIVEDRNLNQALDAALKFAPNVQIVTGRAQRLQQDAASACVHLEHGGALRASLVVGADGAQSWVRAQCEIGIDYRSYGQHAVVSNFACELPHHGTAHQWFTAHEGIVALLPLPGQQVSLVWSAPDALAAVMMQESAAQLAERVARVSGFCLGALTPLQPELMRDFPLRLIRPHTVIGERVALIGDAAHVVHPLAGHGMNLGFGDVDDLLHTIAAREAHRDCGDQRVLARYARARKEDVLLMQIATDGLARLFGSDFEPLRVARNLGMNLFDKLPVLKNRLISHALGRLR